MLTARSDQLGESSRRLLEIVCVAGQPVDLRVAATAGALSGNGRHELITLQEERLLRQASAAGVRIEAYHDRIREVVIAGLSPGALRERHRSLAQVLVRADVPDAPALHRHFLGAGEIRAAADWGVEAAERADRALAFGEAATFYRAALELRGSADASRQALLVRLANALVNAGRGAEAAPLFIEAAEHCDEIEALDLRRRAAEQYLQTGRLEEGVASIRSLFRDLGLAYPRSERSAAVATLVGLAGVALRGARPSRPRSAIVQRDRLRIETVRSAAKGLAMVDPLRGLYFAVHGLILALRSGDPYFVTRELAGVGATLIPAGPPFARWARRIASRARTMAQELGDPYLLGFTAVVHAQEFMVDGMWTEMLRCCDDGAEILREKCRGVSWELAIAGAAAERALEELGRPVDALQRIEVALQQARETADIVRICSCIQYSGMVHLLQGRTHEAREAAQRSREMWPGQGFQMQHFYAMRLEAYAALVDDRPLEALRLVEGHWRDITRSQLLRHALIGVDAHLLAARVRIAVPNTGGDMVRRARWHARRIVAAGTAPMRGHGHMIEAAIALAAGDRAQSIAHLRDAAGLFERAEMRLSEAAAMHLLARFCVDARTHDATANAIFARAGIDDVARHMRLYGFPATI